MKKLIILVSLLLSAFIGVATHAYTVQKGDYLSKIGEKFGTTWQELWRLNPQIEDPNLIYPGQELNTGEGMLGGTLPVAGQTYYLAGSGVTASASSITLQSLTIPQSGYELLDADFSSTFYLTLEPGNTKRQEIVSCTTVVQNANDTATLSGCSRGLLPFSPYTASTTYAFAHAGGTQVIFSNAPQLYNEYPAKTNTESISGTWTFTGQTAFTTIPTTTTSTPTEAGHLITLDYLSTVTSTGCTNSSDSVRGCVEEATNSEMLAATVTGTTGAKLFVPVSQTVSSSAGSADGGKLARLRADGKLDYTLGGSASSTATLDSNTLVIQNPANATTTPTASKIPLASGSGKINNNWVTTGTSAGNLVAVDGSNKLPAIDGSQLTNLTATKKITASTTDSSNTGLTETTLLTFTVPANTLGTSNGVRVRAHMTWASGDHGSQTISLRMKYGGADVAAVTTTAGDVSAGDGDLTLTLLANNSTSAQEGSFFMPFSTGASAATDRMESLSALGTSSVDSTQDQTFSITWDWAQTPGGQTVTMHHFIAEKIQ